MSLIPFADVDKAVELAMSQYGSLPVSAQVHHEKIASIYGELIEGVPADEQIANQGRLIAVLYWKLAQARGYVPAEV